MNTLRYFQAIAYPGIDPARVAANYLRATQAIAAVCGMTFVPAESPGVADVLASSGPIDGPYGVLAISELPPTPGYQGTLTQNFDVAETWLDDDMMVAMMTHELFHVLGMGHTSVPNQLMNPVLSAAITTPQSEDIAAAVSLYGPPAAEVPSQAPPPASSTYQTTTHADAAGPLNFELDGVSVPAAGDYRVTLTVERIGS